MPDALMLFAAGFGTRMGALTAERPKPLIAVAGRALIDHALDLARDAGIARIVVNTHYRAEQLHDHLSGRGVTISHEAGAILDTGGGLRKALPLLGADTVFTLNSDAIWTGPNPLRRLADAWDPHRMDALLLLVAADAARGYRGPGDFALDAEGRVSRAGPSVYTGAQIVRTELLGDIAEEAFSLNRVWDRAIAAGRLFGILHAGGWCDVGHPGGIAEAEAMLAEVGDG
ncbi:nucleotidyltransferase family protein [Rhodovulum sp.]|uniref:nucleotidyltransferase family protein n=1 Tax=Rhodovulum sp. TaxID=34009 RepID=UPI00180E4346|nr:nucleotidyltransferase family protein [Rhodovulum sp.]HDR27305.1 nucleotidyltransferase family protein [Rhodovulum sp.]